MFVSSTWGFADLGSWPEASGATGAEAGDAICQSLAASASLENPGNFHAWISDSATDAYCRVLGLAGKKADNCGQATLPDGGPWLRTDGFPFAAAIDQLMAPNGVVYSPLQLDELGSPIPAFAEFFTATQADGTLDSANTTCSDWQSSAKTSE